MSEISKPTQGGGKNSMIVLALCFAGQSRNSWLYTM